MGSSAGKLLAEPKKLWSLSEMERTGGEPDVVLFDKKTNEYAFSRLQCRKPQRPQKPLLRQRKHLLRAKNISPKGVPLAWHTPWALNCLQKSSTISSSDAGQLRYENIKLGANTCRYSRTRWCTLLRFSIQHGFHVPQWGRIVLRRPRLSGNASGIEKYHRKEMKKRRGILLFALVGAIYYTHAYAKNNTPYMV